MSDNDKPPCPARPDPSIGAVTARALDGNARRGEPVDTRPSIAELMQAHAVAIDNTQQASPWMAARDSLIAAAPVLLEIAQAALAWQETHGAPRGDRRADAAEQALLAALFKVRP